MTLSNTDLTPILNEFKALVPDILRSELENDVAGKTIDEIVSDEKIIDQMTLELLATFGTYQYIKDEIRSWSESDLLNDMVEETISSSDQT